MRLPTLLKAAFLRPLRRPPVSAASGESPAPAHPPVRQLDALTSLRFFAAFYVLVFHFDGFYFTDAEKHAAILLGNTGVTFFFVLSGFILAYTYHAVDLGKPEARARYFRARFARIYPAFLFSLVISLPFFAVWVLKSEAPLKQLMASGAVLAPLGLHAWVPGAACSLNCASWSISVEAFFYLLFPFLLPLVLRRPAEYALAALALWAVFGAFATYAWSHYAPGVSLIQPEAAGPMPVLLAQAIKYDPLLRLPEFVAGLVLFALWRKRNLPVPVLLGVAAAFAALLVLAYPLVPQPLMHNGLTILVWGPLVLAGASLRGGVLGSVMASRPLVFLGRISFALYLLHMPVYAILSAVDRAALGGALSARPALAAFLATLLSLVGAALVHLLIEEPGRRVLLRPAAWPRLPAWGGFRPWGASESTGRR